MKKEIFNLEYQYSLFLKRKNLTEEEMPPTQRKQLKHVFMIASSQMLLLLFDEVFKLEKDQINSTLQNLLDQVNNYVQNELKKQDEKKPLG